MIAVIDTETNGRDPAEVIELAVRWLREPDFSTDHVSIYRYKPTKGSLAGALAVHHILDEELAACSPSSEARLSPELKYIIGHNIDYDWKALGCPEVKRICTLAIARHLFPDEDSHSLGAMLYRLLPGKDARELCKGLHGADADAALCDYILSLMLANANIGKFFSAEDLWKFSEVCRIPLVCSFGKYRGKKFSEIPRDYKMWYFKQADIDPYVEKAMRNSL